jgi:CRP-like cAMP-binding protein
MKPAGRPRSPIAARATSTSGGNHFLDGPLADLYTRLLPHFEVVSLPLKHVLFREDVLVPDVYFPDTGAISLVTRMPDGNTLEVGLVGRDGIVGAPIDVGVGWVPYDGVVQMAGRARRIGGDRLREDIRRDPVAHDVFGRYVQYQLAITIQAAACNNFHSLTARCARWLLQMHDFASGGFAITQDFLSQMLGTRRATVATIVTDLEQRGLILRGRGRIDVHDREGLERVTCSCYRMQFKIRRRLLDF